MFYDEYYLCFPSKIVSCVPSDIVFFTSAQGLPKYCFRAGEKRILTFQFFSSSLIPKSKKHDISRRKAPFWYPPQNDPTFFLFISSLSRLRSMRSESSSGASSAYGRGSSRESYSQLQKLPSCFISERSVTIRRQRKFAVLKRWQCSQAVSLVEFSPGFGQISAHNVALTPPISMIYYCTTYKLQRG